MSMENQLGFTMNYQHALAFMSKAKNIDNGRPTGQRGTRMLYDTHYKSKMPIVSLMYHNTILVQWRHDCTLFTNNGWQTPTTMRRIREHLRPLGYDIYTKKGVKYLRDLADIFTGHKMIPLSNNFMFTISHDGEVTIKY